ncbi:MAG: malate dehydrogenase [Candidatus Eisenbacteria bacterium]|nr:malate dehydrogenase [Candidatus Eisenbacteria bacterium]
MKNKVTIVGAGNVGATAAHWAAEKEFADIVLIDVIPDMPKGKALDLMETGPVEGFDTKIIGTNDYKDTANSDVVVITAGLARKPGMSRDDLLEANRKIVYECTENVVKYSPDAILVIVSNPLDAMCHVAKAVSKFPKNRVFGMAGILDTARFRCFISMEMGVSVEDIQAMVLGGHGDTMVPLPRYTTVAGVPITELLPKEKIDAMVKRTAQAGGEIVALLKTGSAYYSPSASVIQIVEAILKDKKRVVPCAAYLEGEYGIKGLYVGVPVKIGAKGVEQVMELKLTADEQAALNKSAAAVRELVDIMKL